MSVRNCHIQHFTPTLQSALHVAQRDHKSHPRLLSPWGLGHWWECYLEGTLFLTRLKWLWFGICIWPPSPSSPQPEFLPEIKKSPQTIHVVYFWKALGTRTPMAMFWCVRHANTQIQIQIQIRKYNYQCSQLRNPPMNVKGTRTKVYWGPSVFVFVFLFIFVYLHVCLGPQNIAIGVLVPRAFQKYTTYIWSVVTF